MKPDKFSVIILDPFPSDDEIALLPRMTPEEASDIMTDEEDAKLLEDIQQHGAVNVAAQSGVPLEAIQGFYEDKLRGAKKK